MLGSVTETVRSGGYVPFGTETTSGQVIKGDVKCNGAILRCQRDGMDLEVVAWGLRNPYRVAFHPDGRLFATEHGMDERSGRYVVGDYDDLYEIVEGAWYGWPDFASGIPLDDPSWSDGRGREPLLAEHPEPNPPKPVVTFDPHAGANGLDISRDERFGFVGQGFVALFGDLAPVTTRTSTPVGFKVVRVDLTTRQVHDFAVNKIAGPASKLPHRGMERPSHCQFGPDGALYVVDWGKISIAPEAGGVRMPEASGILWRIRPTGAPQGEHPRPPLPSPPTRSSPSSPASVPSPRRPRSSAADVTIAAPLRKLVQDLQGLMGAADLYDLTLIDEFWNHEAPIGMELKLRTEDWAPAGSASDQALDGALDDFRSWVMEVLASTVDERT